MSRHLRFERMAIECDSHKRRMDAVKKLGFHNDVCGLVNVLNRGRHKDSIEEAEILLNKYPTK